MNNHSQLDKHRTKDFIEFLQVKLKEQIGSPESLKTGYLISLLKLDLNEIELFLEYGGNIPSDLMEQRNSNQKKVLDKWRLNLGAEGFFKIAEAVNEDYIFDLKLEKEEWLKKKNSLV